MEDAVISETPGVIGRLVNRHVTLCLSIHARMHDVEAPGEIRKSALRRLFDEAEDSSAILFFDEADALFGKRSEVKDSHDRYANLELNFLHDCVRNFQGLIILSFKRHHALDSTFMARIQCHLSFRHRTRPLAKRNQR